MIAKYITFEGTEGTGKTTLSKNLAKHMNAHWMMEPDVNDAVCKQLKQYCLDTQYESVTKSAREYMLLANRSILMQSVVNKLVRGEQVVSDRSFLSGMVYAKMEGFDFQKWWTAQKALDCIPMFPDVCVLVTSDTYTPVKNENDRYDHRNEVFFKEVENCFEQAIDFVNRSPVKTKFIGFRMNFDVTPKENLRQLLKVLSIHGIGV